MSRARGRRGVAGIAIASFAFHLDPLKLARASSVRGCPLSRRTQVVFHKDGKTAP